jgi:PadR family transcriptional regulator, regulatory protein PadR
MGKPSDLLQGTLDLLILKTLSLEPRHGWAIARRIEQVSQDALQITQGALYPALHRLEHQGWIRSEWRTTDTGRDAKFSNSPKPVACNSKRSSRNGTACQARWGLWSGWSKRADQ